MHSRPLSTFPLSTWNTKNNYYNPNHHSRFTITRKIVEIRMVPNTLRNCNSHWHQQFPSVPLAYLDILYHNLQISTQNTIHLAARTEQQENRKTKINNGYTSASTVINIHKCPTPTCPILDTKIKNSTCLSSRSSCMLHD